jgi:hypothetical protein
MNRPSARPLWLGHGAGAGAGAGARAGGGAGTAAGATGAGGGNGAAPAATAPGPAAASMEANSRWSGNAGEGAKYCGGCFKYWPDGSVIPATLVWQPVDVTSASPMPARPRHCQRRIVFMIVTSSALSLKPAPARVGNTDDRPKAPRFCGWPRLPGRANSTRSVTVTRISLVLSDRRWQRIYWICRQGWAQWYRSFVMMVKLARW